MSDLGARFVACRRWRWISGMRWTLAPFCGGQSIGQMNGRVDEMWRAVDDAGRILTDHDNIRPVPEDPATLGCILALVREAWGLPRTVVAYRGRWHVLFHGWTQPHPTIGTFSGDTEAAALLAALEAAP